MTRYPGRRAAGAVTRALGVCARTLLTGLVLVCCNAYAAPVPWWTVPGVPGDRNASPLPPPGPSAGLTVTLNKGAALLANPAASAAFDLAAQYAASWIADPINMIINVNIAADSSHLGSSNPSFLSAGYNTTRNRLINDQVAHVGAGDITDYLPTLSAFSAQVPTGFSVGTQVSMTRANAKALGIDPAFLPGGVNGSDGSITLSTAFAWDYTPLDGISAGMFDFFGVALHEIGHIMGFVSEVDTADAIMNAGGTATLSPSTLDLFRLAPGAGVINFTNSARILKPGVASVTYLGAATEAGMSTGSAFGDGRSASHWKDNLGIGMMDPTFAPGEAAVPDMTDLRAFDLIGWDAVPASTAVPVPAAVWLFGSGLALLGFTGKRRRSA